MGIEFAGDAGWVTFIDVHCSVDIRLSVAEESAIPLSAGLPGPVVVAPLKVAV